MVELSADLLPEILAFCDRVTLLTTSLVSRQWRDVSRRIFSSENIVLKFDGTPKEFNQLQNFVEQREQCTFQWGRVRHLTIVVNQQLQETDNSNLRIPVPLPPGHEDTLARLAEQIGANPQSLSFQSATDNILSHRYHFITTIFSLYPSITRLEYQVQGASVIGILGLVKSLRGLRVLEISCKNDYNDVDPSDFTFPVNLEEFRLRTCFGPHSSQCQYRGTGHEFPTRWSLSRSHSPGRLNKVEIVDCQCTPATEALAHLFPAMESLYLGSGNKGPLDIFLFNFSRLTYLQCITIDTAGANALVAPERFKWIYNSTASIYQALKRSQSSYLTEIIFVASPELLEVTGAWIKFDQLLSQPKLSTIRKLTFTFPVSTCGEWINDSLVSLVREQFPYCLAVGRKVDARVVEDGSLSMFEWATGIRLRAPLFVRL
ncbi:hypothetical protein WG66_013411 [Moniliophthora roreri]|uniref:F-box domain-containing protein n=1 Tax=Moniliophthora roreri TaxID=221103 RepID=A0A0W0F2V7_MONRR|nr:hypothetical protein WG66_013411 [Moniliophthora roreri]